MRCTTLWRLALAAGAWLSCARPLAAQKDYRNLDDDRPMFVEDAWPVERHAFEAVLALASARTTGAWRHGLVPELAWGALRDVQVGVKAPLVRGAGPGGTEVALAGLRAFALVNVSTETRTLPGLAIRVDGYIPAGGLGGDRTRGRVRFIATRALGVNRLHLNGALAVGAPGIEPALEGAGRWSVGAAVDRTFWRQSLLLVGEVSAQQHRAGAETEVQAGLGTRWQWTPTTVLDAGVHRRLGAHGADLALTVGVTRAFAVRGLMPRGGGPSLGGRGEQFYLPGAFNWRFLRDFPAAGRLFNAFDYGHAVLYEVLATHDSAAAAARLEREYAFLTRDLLLRPPRFAVAEDAIAPVYARMAWRAKLMFDWAHVLHRQLYDIYAMPGLDSAQRHARAEDATDYYLSRTDLAFTTAPKAMELMDAQAYSQVFKRRAPAFNGLIWAYHWLQVGLYEPLLREPTAAGRQSGVAATVARFHAMLADPPRSMPTVMPMTTAIAPLFTARHPRAAAIFDNLHMLHDIISDILASDVVPADRKAAVIAQVLREFQDPSRNVMSLDHWLNMAEHMGGIELMGGPVPGAAAAAGAHDHH